MIPKVIHYCWFGGNPLPEFAVKCVNSWRRYMPDYEIKEWNESNFDVNIIPYTKEAYVYIWNLAICDNKDGSRGCQAQ